MRSFEFERWDAGRLTVNREFADLLRESRLTTFESLMRFEGGTVAKNVLRERTTTRFVLRMPAGPGLCLTNQNVGYAARVPCGKPSIRGAAYPTIRLVQPGTDVPACASTWSGDSVARHVRSRSDRTTLAVERAFYLKRHGRPPWKEYVKPLLRLTRPILGARHEWHAMIRFHQVGIPTMVPVALGESDGCSFVVTEAIEGCRKLSDWMEAALDAPASRRDPRVGPIVEDLARIARTMHAAGMHHQDFYLTHLLLPEDDPNRGIHVIDLGRVRQRRRLSQRWVVKDLAQLNYSSRLFTEADRRRFLESYLNRPLTASDRRFLARIRRKTERIAQHSRKNGL